MKLQVKAGTTSLRVLVFMQDSTSTTGAGKTGLTYNSSGLIAYYGIAGSASTAITLATQTVTGAFSSGGFVEYDSTHMAGIYQFDVPNAIIASVGSSVVMFSGATGLAPMSLEIQCVAFDPTNGTNLGITALPNAAATTSGGLLTAGTSSYQIATDSSGRVIYAPGEMQIKKNTALNNFEFLMVSSTDNLTPKTGLSVVAQCSIDGGAIGSCTNSVSEVGSGLYVINLSAADLDGNVITLIFSATGADTRFVTVITQA